MSSHDCRLSGTVIIAAGVTREQLYAAAAPFLEQHELSHNLVNPDAQPDAVDGVSWPGQLAVSFDEASRELTFYADVRGRGGYADEGRDGLVHALSPLVDGPQILEFEDFDSSSVEDAMCPHFFGPTPQDGVRARLRYAADQFDSWASHSGLSAIVRSILDGYPLDGFIVRPPHPPEASGLLRTDLLVTVLHGRGSSLQLDRMALSDVHMLISEGVVAGRVTELDERELASHEVLGELRAAGSEPSSIRRLLGAVRR